MPAKRLQRQSGRVVYGILSGGTEIYDKLGFSLVPGGNPVLGGASLGITKASKKKPLALSYIKWLCSDTISSAATVLGGTSPCKQSYETQSLMETFPWLSLVENSFSKAKGYRQPKECDDRPFNERKFLSIVGIAVKNAFDGLMSPREALDWAQKEYESNFCE